MKYPIHYYGDPVLREKSQVIPEISPDVRVLADNMIETMHAARGIGLAAQQVGHTESICVVDLPTEMDEGDGGERLNPDVAMPLVLINPEVCDGSEETTVYEEGCLSFPDMHGNIERPWTVSVRYQDLEGVAHDRTIHGMLARVIQHEVDHLNGVLFIDRMSHVKKLALKGRLRRLRDETQSKLDGVQA